MGYVPTANDKAIAAAQAIIKMLGDSRYADSEDAIAFRIMEHCYPQEFAVEMKKCEDYDSPKAEDPEA